MIATNGTQAVKVQLEHWWPQKFYLGNAIPASMCRRAFRDGTRYMTVASCELPGLAPGTDMTVRAFARCNKSDQPTRKLGRELALQRLSDALMPLGWKLVLP